MEPMPLEQWMAKNLCKTEHTMRNIGPHATFVRDDLSHIIFPDKKPDEDSRCQVVKVVETSVELPVYQFKLEDGVVITIYFDFNEWHVKVHSPFAIDFDPEGRFDPTHAADKVYKNLIPDELKYPCYAEDHRKFSFEIKSTPFSHKDLYAILGSMMYAIKRGYESAKDLDRALVCT